MHESVIIDPSKEGFVRNVLENPFRITDEQFGKKIRKHSKDYGVDPSDPDDRAFLRKEIHNIVNNCDEVTSGFWRGQKNDVIFYIKGDDVIIANQKNKFVSILKDGAINNERIKDYRYRKV